MANDAKGIAMDPIRIEFELTAGDYEDFYNSSPIQPAKLVKPLTLLGLGLLGAVFTISPQGGLHGSARLLAIPLTLLLMAVSAGFSPSFRRRFIQARMGKPGWVTFDETKLQWLDPEGQGTLGMDPPLRWRETSTLIVVARNGPSPLIIPKRAMTNEQLQALRSVLEAGSRSVVQRNS